MFKNKTLLITGGTAAAQLVLLTGIVSCGFG